MSTTNAPESIAEQMELESGVIIPPCDLWSDEPPLESDWHREQIELLLACLKQHWRERSDFYASGNLTIYFSPDQIKSRDFKGPDFFVVLGATPEPRKSWVVWAESGKYPNVIVEILSESTANVDRTAKKQLYQDTFRTPNYVWFDPYSFELMGFQLISGHYQEIPANSEGWLWSDQLELYLGVYDTKLRLFTAEGQLVASPAELAEQERQRAERLAEKLREMGIDPSAI
ncbi:Uma2 family endonuclease [Oculatella sp. LEGE 06141]|uniref:Uma2 family endonuclease n=1 Tax=Oculatella sp. LEGE 06141 TaxID=1828648 RepID=UPI00187E8C5C|nr:Uma2 family endonuclease [Oculatella sp. LEGE 06141]MBE9176963.1 Uma2 family endonuclease [Oculatella sp. LEGE 06141]